jgi:colanic acid biosynthesis glycosyl transferase WcaI
MTIELTFDADALPVAAATGAGPARRPARVLVVAANHAPEPIGIGRYVGEMADWLCARGADVRVVAAPPYYPGWQVADGWSSREWRVDGGRGPTTFRCPIYVPRQPTGARRLLHLASFAASSAPVLLWQALSWRPDLVFVVEPPLACAPAALAAARLCGARAWLHVQDLEVDAAFDLGLLRGERRRSAALQAECALLRGFDRVSTISRSMDERLARKGVPAAKRTYFPNWVDAARFCAPTGSSALRHELRLPPDSLVALYAGSLGRKQALDTVIDAARRLSTRGDLRFVIAGDGPERTRLVAAAAGLPNVDFLPLQPDERFAALLGVADVHLLPQRAEVEDLVMPSKLAAMMASGRPVLAAARADTEVANAVAHGGLTVPPGNVEALCSALLALSADAPRRAALGAAGREYARREWDKGAVLERVLGPELTVRSAAVTES